MHETSLGAVIRDYLTGREIEETTYEEFRQALARLLVEDKGYPRDCLRSKVGVGFQVDGQDYCRTVDLVAYSAQGGPLLVVIFCAGDVESYVRETVAAARLLEGGPVPLVLVTDTKEALLVETGQGEVLAESMRAVPHWDELARLAVGVDSPALSAERLERERRILYTYSEFLFGGCCNASCPVTKG